MDIYMKRAIFWIILALLIVAIVGVNYIAKRTPGKLDSFAQCLNDSGTVYYGAFWCPNCQAQNKMFGKSKQYLPYVECSTPDGKSQLQVCKDKNVTNYPTWEFPDGSRLLGQRSVSELSEKTGCALPSE